MKLPLRLAVIGSIASVLLGVLFVSTTSAEDALTSEQVQRIQANCQSMKSTLNQLHVSDALLRVNRGQFYESVASKLMDRFNSRLSTNGIDILQLTDATTQFRSTLNTFRSMYHDYEKQLSAAIAIDCTKQPEAFHQSVQAARTKRTAVHSEVLKMNQYMTDYKTAVDAFATSYIQATSGVQQ